jgi:hypothetical protein
MDRQSFYFLYVNLNSLAELALQQLAAKILAQTPQPGPLEHLSDEERDARVLASFENIDLSALDGLGVANTTEDAHLDELPPELPAESMSEPPTEGDEELDVERYLARAYSYEEQLRGRIDDCYGRADLSGMEAALLQLPDHLSALTGQLSAAQMEEWLALYEQGHAALGDLTIQIRRLDMGGT